MKTHTQINWNASEQNDWTGIELIDTETGETHATIDGCTPEALALIANAPELLAALQNLQKAVTNAPDIRVGEFSTLVGDAIAKVEAQA